MKLKLVTTLLVACALLLSATAYGSVVGKIKGTVTDQQSGEPLIGATVAVVGTALGAVTNEAGEYSVNNVPVGTYVVRITAVGFQPVEVTNVEVSADLAAYIDQGMTSSVTELDKVITVTAERPLVTPDKTTAINIVSKDEIQAMPVQSFEDVVGIQNSVVRMNAGNSLQRQRGQRQSQSDNVEMNLRGGRPQEIAFYVDGFSQQDPLTGLSTVRLNTNAIKELNVTSGAFSAEYGHVASGIVQVFTSGGTNEYHGNLEVMTDNVLPDNYDHNIYSFDLGGPIPGLEKGFFFGSIERRWLRDRTPSPKTEEMVEVYGEPFNLDSLYDPDNTQRLPGNHIDGWAYQGKLDYDLTPNMRLSASGNGSITNWREYRQEWALNPKHGPRYEDKNLGLNLKLTHTLNATTFYNVAGSYFKTTRLRGDAVIWDDYDAYVKPWANPEEDAPNLFMTPAEQVTYNDGADTIVTESWYAGYLDQRSSYLQFSGDLTKQIEDDWTLKSGLEIQYHTLRRFQNLDAAARIRTSQEVNRYGFDENGETSDDEGFKNDTKHPINIGAYIQNRWDFQGLIINGGLRLDYYDYEAEGFANQQAPFGDDDQLDESDLTEVDPFWRISPRLGISFPVSASTQMRINYGIMYQRPLLENLYLGLDFYEARVGAGSYYPFASPLLEPEKTTQYEVGIAHQLSDNVAFEIAAYYKDVQDLTQIQHVSDAFPTAYDIFGNLDYGTIKGVDFGFMMRRSRNLRLDVRYTLSYASGTGSYGWTRYHIAWQNPSGNPKTTSPLDYDQRHNFSAVVDWRTGEGQGPRFGDIFPMENMSLNFIATAGSGTPYTPMQVYDEVTLASVSSYPRDKINSGHMPWRFQIDAKLEREFRVGNFELTPYIYVQNLLDKENVIGVYESTGQPDKIGYLETPAGQVSADQFADQQYSEKYLLGEANPTNYSIPRMVFFGLRTSF